MHNLPNFLLQGMTNIVGLTFSVGNKHSTVVNNSYGARQLEMVTLNIIFNVVTDEIGWV